MTVETASVGWTYRMRLLLGQTRGVGSTQWRPPEQRRGSADVDDSDLVPCLRRMATLGWGRSRVNAVWLMWLMWSGKSSTVAAF